MASINDDSNTNEVILVSNKQLGETLTNVFDGVGKSLSALVASSTAIEHSMEEIEKNTHVLEDVHSSKNKASIRKKAKKDKTTQKDTEKRLKKLLDNKAESKAESKGLISSIRAGFRNSKKKDKKDSKVIISSIKKGFKGTADPDDKESFFKSDKDFDGDILSTVKASFGDFIDMKNMFMEGANTVKGPGVGTVIGTVLGAGLGGIAALLIPPTKCSNNEAPETNPDGTDTTKKQKKQFNKDQEFDSQMNKYAYQSMNMYLDKFIDKKNSARVEYKDSGRRKELDKLSEKKYVKDGLYSDAFNIIKDNGTRNAGVESQEILNMYNTQKQAYNFDGYGKNGAKKPSEINSNVYRKIIKGGFTGGDSLGDISPEDINRGNMKMIPGWKDMFAPKTKDAKFKSSMRANKKHEDYVMLNKKNNPNINGLNSGLHNKFNAMGKDINANYMGGGGKLVINSALRNDGVHKQGYAIDANIMGPDGRPLGDGNIPEEFLSKYGLHRPLLHLKSWYGGEKDEPWHIEPYPGEEIYGSPRNSLAPYQPYRKGVVFNDKSKSNTYTPQTGGGGLNIPQGNVDVAVNRNNNDTDIDIEVKSIEDLANTVGGVISKASPKKEIHPTPQHNSRKNI